MQEMLSRLFWILFEIGLVIGEAAFCIQLQFVHKAHKKVKKEYSLATNDGCNGHSGRLINEVEKELISIRIQLISWMCIVITCAYAIVDCFSTHII